MLMIDIKLKIVKYLDESGFLIEEFKEESDINLQEYILDSIQFINLIVSIEDEFEIEWPDELCTYEQISSLDHVSELVQELLKEKTMQELDMCNFHSHFYK